MATATEAVLIESDFVSFRPYEERDTVPLPKGKNNIEINVGNTRIVFQKTPPPTRRVIATQPKKIPRVDSWSNRSSVSSLSQVSAVGMTTGSMGSVQQSHRSMVEEHYGMKISSVRFKKIVFYQNVCLQFIMQAFPRQECRYDYYCIGTSIPPLEENNCL